MLNLSAFEEGQEGVAIMAFQKEKASVVESLQARIKKCKDIHDPRKRRGAMTNLQSLIKHLDEIDTEILHGIWLIVKTEVFPYEVPRSYVEKWGIKNYSLWSEIPKDYLEDVFVNQDLKHAVFCEKNKMTHQEGTLHKCRDVETIMDWSTMEDSFVVYGKNVSPKLVPIPKMLAILPKNLSWQEVIAEFEKKEKLEIHARLAKTIDKMNHPKECNLLLYKKDIPTAMEEYSIKELFILRKEKELIESANCKVWIVDSIDRGDISDKLENDFAGMIGVRYFAF
jgi:hypothetical protein